MLSSLRLGAVDVQGRAQAAHRAILKKRTNPHVAF
jgi:hypothetical protein